MKAMGQRRSCYNGTRLFPDNVRQIDFRDRSAFQMLDIVKWSRETEMAAKYKENLGVNKKSEELCFQGEVLRFSTLCEPGKKLINKYLLLTDTGMSTCIEE